jgi:hypothetical protein
MSGVEHVKSNLTSGSSAVKRDQEVRRWGDASLSLLLLLSTAILLTQVVGNDLCCRVGVFSSGIVEFRGHSDNNNAWTLNNQLGKIVSLDFNNEGLCFLSSLSRWSTVINNIKFRGYATLLLLSSLSTTTLRREVSLIEVEQQGRSKSVGSCRFRFELGEPGVLLLGSPHDNLGRLSSETLTMNPSFS